MVEGVGLTDRVKERAGVVVAVTAPDREYIMMATSLANMWLRELSIKVGPEMTFSFYTCFLSL